MSGLPLHLFIVFDVKQGVPRDGNCYFSRHDVFESELGDGCELREYVPAQKVESPAPTGNTGMDAIALLKEMVAEIERCGSYRFGKN